MRGGAANCRGGQPCPRGGDGVRFTEQVGSAPRGWRCPAGWGRAAEACPGSGRHGSSARPRPRPGRPSDSPCRCWQGVEDGVGRSSSWGAVGGETRKPEAALYAPFLAGPASARRSRAPHTRPRHHAAAGDGREAC